MRPHMNLGKVYRTSKLEEKSWKIIGFLLENAPIRKKYSPKFENYFN